MHLVLGNAGDKETRHEHLPSHGTQAPYDGGGLDQGALTMSPERREEWISAVNSCSFEHEHPVYLMASLVTGKET